MRRTETPQPKPIGRTAPDRTNRTDPIATLIHYGVKKPAPQPKEEGPFNFTFRIGNPFSCNHAHASGAIISRPFPGGEGKAYFARIDNYTIPNVTIYGAEGRLKEIHPEITGSNVLIPLNGSGRSKAERKITQYILQQARYKQADQTFKEWHDHKFGRKHAIHGGGHSQRPRTHSRAIYTRY